MSQERKPVDSVELDCAAGSNTHLSYSQRTLLISDEGGTMLSLTLPDGWDLSTSIAPASNETNIDTLTEYQLLIRQWAEHMAQVNPDAAEELGKWLISKAEEGKRFKGFGIMVRYNEITNKIELKNGE